VVDGCAGRPARTGRFPAFGFPTSFIAGHTSAARGAGLRKLARTAPLKVLRGSRRRSSRISGTRFCIPRQDSRDTGWDRGYRWYCSQFSNFWWYRTVGPVGPPWKIADPRGQPWAHWSHLSVPPVRANSCGVPPVPPVPCEETVRRDEDGIGNHDGSLSRMSSGIGRRGLKGRPRCGLDNTTISGHSRNYAHCEHQDHGRITVASYFSRRG